MNYARLKRLAASPLIRRLRGLVGGLLRDAPAPRAPRFTPETFSLFDPEIVRDPFPHYAELRARGAVHFLPRHDFWVVLGFDEVHAALTRPEDFSNRVTDYTQVDSVLLAADPPEHTAARRAVAQLFSPQAVEAQSAFAEETAERLLAPLLAGERFEVLQDFAFPLVEEVVAHMLGLDDAAVAAVRASQRSGQDLARQFATLDSVVEAAADRLEVYQSLLEGGFEPAQARSLLRLLWVAGTTTTRRAVASSVLLLLREPDARRSVTEEPALLPAFVEEAVRLHPPEHMLSRVARLGAELAGVNIPAGAAVKLCVAAANRDPTRFDRPDALLLERAPNRQLSFGGGLHRCVGAALARTEAAAALRALLRLAPGFRAARPLDAVRFAGFANDAERLEITR